MLVNALRSGEQGVQDLAVVQISLLGPKTVPFLASALEDALDEADLLPSHGATSSAERAVAGICNALGVIKDSDSVVDLAAALPRKEAVEALAKIGGERALDLVIDTMENELTPMTPQRHHGGRSAGGSNSAETDPAFVKRVFLRFGEAGRRRLQRELEGASGQRRDALAEIVRIMRYSSPGT